MHCKRGNQERHFHSIILRLDIRAMEMVLKIRFYQGSSKKEKIKISYTRVL